MEPTPSIDTFEDLIGHWDSVRAFAERMRVSPNTAAGWKRRNSIPTDYWPELLEAAAERELTVRAEDLVRLATRSH